MQHIVKITFPGVWVRGANAIPRGGVGLVIGLALSGCASTIDYAKGQSESDYFGVVRVTAPTPTGGSPDRIIGLTVTGIGLRLNDGIGFGYFSDRVVSIPLECHLVVFVSEENQMEDALNKIRQIGGQSCVALEP